jgi:putative oxidoreductase
MNALNRFADPFYCIMRFIVGLMFACHGLDKIFGTFAGKTEALPPLMMIGGWVEIICGFLVAFVCRRELRRLSLPVKWRWHFL